MERVRMGTPARMYLVLLVSVVLVGLVSHGDATTSPPDQDEVAVSLNASHVNPGEVQQDTDYDNSTLESAEATTSPGNQSEVIVDLDSPLVTPGYVQQDTDNDNNTLEIEETTLSPGNQSEMLLSMDTPHFPLRPVEEDTDNDNSTIGHEARHRIFNTPENGVGKLSLEDQAKVAVSLDVANVVIVKMQNYIDNYTRTIKRLQLIATTITAAEKATTVQNIVKSAADIGIFMSFVSAASTIFSVMATFFIPSEFDVIKENFEDVNNKLSAITSQMVSIRNELNSSIEFNTWVTTYIEWERDIQNGKSMLVETQGRLAQLEDESQRLKLMESYIQYFENQDIEGKAIKIYKLTALDSSTTRSNLFELYVREKGCDVVELSRLMFIIRDLMTSAARQAVVYQFLKYGSVDYAREKMATFYGRLYEIRRQYDLHVWYCQRDSVKYAKELAKKVIETHKQASKETLSKILYGRLSDLMPWYEWAVALYKQAPSVTIQLNDLTSVTVQFSDSSGQFFTLTKVASNDDINILVVWQDISDESHGCQDTVDANTFVPFQFHPESNNDILTSSDHMITGKECINYLRDIVFNNIQSCIGNYDCNSIISNVLHEDKYSFVAAGFSRLRDPCLSQDVCNNHGICRHIPHTSQHLCLCHEYFDGDDCHEYHDPATAHKITDMVASLRQNFSEFIGVPTVVDVYFNIKDLPNQIKLVRQRIMPSIKYTQILALHGQVFNDAEYINVAYNQLQSGEISEEIYENRINGINFHRIISDLKKVLLGQGILIQQDFLSVFKKSLISESGSQVACTQSYSTAVSHMIKTLVTLDQAVTEARLWASHWRVQQMTGPEALETVDGAQRVLKAAQRRRSEYTAYWEATSCPKLTTGDLQQRHCDVGHSYEGLQVTLTCANQKQPSPSSVNCTKLQDKMQWSATPQCVYVWGSWSSWSSCSKTCGGGQRTKRRSKPNNETTTLDEACNTQDCCQAKYGKFKCSNGRCVSQSYVCDGDNDCGDGSDEARSRCSYLRVGDTIALKNHCGGQGFLSCYCSVNCDQKCKTRSCPGLSMDNSDWDDCRSERFNYIIAFGRNTGDAIRYGDKIAIRYAHYSGDEGWWLSCSGRGSSCRTRTCPGKYFSESETSNCRGEVFWIYSYNRRGSCGTDIDGTCARKPLYPGDEVSILYTPNSDHGGYWLSGRSMGEEVVTRTCPGRHVPSYNCGCERWTLYRR